MYRRIDCLLLLLCVSLCTAFKIEGKVSIPSGKALEETRVLVDDGTYRGFIKNDGSFVVHNIPSGSYVLEVVSPVYFFEPIRVELSTKGNVRARKLNLVKPSAVSLLKYPVDLKPIGLTKYFQEREKFSIFDMLKNPMVLMMVLPMLILVVLPKMMNTSDPEVRKEMEESMKMFNPGQSQMPDLSEAVTNFFKSGPSKKSASSTKSIKSKKQK
uniref:Endoplasmic reticulum membrane protein complex subunit 7 n=1 Tax=Phallusia mammillata TaxID=59560 RepID=A0A6F9DC30_9ASCI|nr:ER membrane protein complex subunit 7 [Phallusia mammillata]